jgi:hypothetical protein
MTEVVPRPTAVIQVNHRDQTGHFSPWLEELTFTDHLAGEADGLEIKLDNSDGRWFREWYPVKGSTLEAWLGYEGSPLLGTGECQVDEIELEGGPDLVTIRALGAGNQVALRTPKSRAFEGKSMRAIANEVAATHGLRLVGEVPDIVWRRVTQNRETDLGFLCRLGEEHGLVFSVKGDKLVFHDVQKLEGQGPILKLTRSDLSTFRFREKVVEGGASAAYFDGSTKELRVVELQMEHPHADRKKIRRRTESTAHTQRLARAAIQTSKSWERDGTLTLPGHTRLVAGANLELTDLGVLDGLWLIRSARHTQARGQGYTTELEVRHVAK